MKNDVVLAKRNVELSFEFSRYLLAHPELDEKIPDDALITFQVANDPELTAYNTALAKRTKTPNQPVVVVTIQGLAPTRLLKPRVTVTA